MKATELFKKLRKAKYKTVGKDLQYLIEIDENEKKIRVMFQESHSVTDWILNFIFPIIPVFIRGVPYNIALGWLISWYSGRKTVINEIIQTMKNYDSYNIVICGYSFGGAIAQLCGIELYERTKSKAELITYGSPRPLFGICRIWAKRCFISVTQYAYKNDIVTYCPPLPFYGTVKNKRIGGRLDLHELFKPEKGHQRYNDENIY